MKTLLWVGDAAVSSGFARATHHTLDVVRQTFDVHVLGLNYMGDPHSYPYPIYPCYPGGDMFGVGRVRGIAEAVKADVIVIQQDPWNFPFYMDALKSFDALVIGAVAVDGKNCAGEMLNGLASAVFWTRFAEREARLGGYTGPSAVVPLGISHDVYRPLEQTKSELKAAILGKVFAQNGLPPDSYVVGVVGRNQPRKRLDLTIQYFADWVHFRKVEDACLWLHVAPTGEMAYDLKGLAKYYGVQGRVFSPTIAPIYGVTEQSLARIYNMMDVLFTTTQGEGWGLPMMEAMACGVPCILPDWSALGDWAADAALLVPCTTTAVTPMLRGATVIGGLMDKALGIEALDALYRDADRRALHAQWGLELTSRPAYRWPVIGAAFTQIIEQTVNGVPISEAVWQDLGRPAESEVGVGTGA